MAWFLAQNPGLRSRFPILIEFPDYTTDELLSVAEAMWQNRQYELTADARAYLKQLLQRADWLAAGDEGNARAMRNLVERSLRCQALRLVGRAGLTREELIAIGRADLEQAMAGHRPAPWGY